jgi:hypothetical protein
VWEEGVRSHARFLSSCEEIEEHECALVYTETGMYALRLEDMDLI